MGITRGYSAILGGELLDLYTKPLFKRFPKELRHLSAFSSMTTIATCINMFSDGIHGAAGVGLLLSIATTRKIIKTAVLHTT